MILCVRKKNNKKNKAPTLPLAGLIGEINKHIFVRKLSEKCDVV